MAVRRRSAADQRRRTHGQNFLVDSGVVARAVERLALDTDDLVVEIGAGRGALTDPLAETGVRLVAVERDRQLAERLRGRYADVDRVHVITCDIRRFRWPREPYRVVGNVPFGVTSDILDALLDDPDKGPTRADLLVQAEVAHKRAAAPPTTLRSAAWAPWWTFTVGDHVTRQAFRPVPAVDAAWLTIRQRTPAVLPTTLAPSFRDHLRPLWSGAHGG